MALVTVNATPDFFGYLVNFVICVVILVLALRIPFKRNYHWTFLLFVAAIALFQLISVFAQGSLTTQAYWSDLHWLGIANPYGALALMFLFLVQFSRSKIRLWQVAVLVGAFGLYIVFLVGQIFYLPLFFKPYGRITPLGYGSTAGPVYKSISFSGINVFFPTLLALLIIQVIVQYRATKSPLVRGQLRYLIIGFVFLYIADTVGSLAILQVIPAAYRPLWNGIAAGTLLFGITRYGSYDVAPASEAGQTIPIEFKLSMGHSYLGLDEGTSLRLFTQLVRNGFQGYCVTRMPPDEFREKYGLRETPVRWLAQSERKDAMNPGDLAGISSSIVKFLRSADRPIVLIEGVELLVSQNGFKPTMAFLDRINKMNAKREGILVAVSSGIAASNAREPALWQVFEEAPLVQARLKAERTVEVGETFQLQLDLFNVGKRPVHIDAVEKIVPDRFEVVDPLGQKINGSTLILEGKTLEPFQLESTILLVRAKESREETLQPKVSYRDGKAVSSSQGVEPFKIRAVQPQDIEFASEQARSVFTYLAQSFSDDYFLKRYSPGESGWRSIIDISKATRISPSSLYGIKGKYGQPVFELLSRGLVEERIFKGHRGRGGESAKLRVSYERDTVRRHVDRSVLKAPWEQATSKSTGKN